MPVNTAPFSKEDKILIGLKDKKLIKKQTYTKTETCKLYSKLF